MRKIKKIEPTPTAPTQRKRVAAYVRVSSGKEAMLHSLSAQISYYNSHIQNRGDWEFAGIYADEALTGTKATRPAFQRLLTDCRAGKIDMVITKSITRFARNTITLLESTRELKLLGIDVFFEKENIHTLSADGEFMLTLLASFAQEESRSASENMKWRIRKMFEQGRPSTCNAIGYRLFDGKLYIVPEEAETVRQIFADYLSGMGVEAIMKKLNASGIKTRRDTKWGCSSIHVILRNEKYTGDLLLQKTYLLDHISKKKMVNRGELPMYYVENSHELIIGNNTFTAVQSEICRRADKFQPNPQPAPTQQYPFTKIIRCGLCGKPYRRKTITGGGHRAKVVWICSTFNIYGKSACPSQQIPEDILIAKTGEALGISEPYVESDVKLEAGLLRQHIAEIQIPAHNRLVYVFVDGHREEKNWQNPSRRESWTEDMKQVARERQQEINRRRRKK